jgi:hypothetical protein
MNKTEVARRMDGGEGLEHYPAFRPCARLRPSPPSDESPH